MTDLIERLRTVKWEEVYDDDRMPDDPAHKCVLVDMRPDDFEALLNEAADALKSPAPERAGVPEGWKLVPVEPTPRMEMAARNHHSLPTYCEDHRISIWRAMIDAAPTPPRPVSSDAAQ